MNFGLLKVFYDRLSVRTKLIGVGIIAFVIGTFFGGRGGDSGMGRYVPFNGGGTLATLDTKTGQVYIVSGDGQTYKRGPKVPYW